MTTTSSSSINRRWFPPPFADPVLELAIRTALSQIYGVEDQAVAGVVNGSALASGSTLVTGSAKAVATGLATVINIVASIDNGGVAFFEIAEGDPSTTPGAIDLYVWKSGPAASTTQRNVRWIAIGTPATPLGGSVVT